MFRRSWVLGTLGLTSLLVGSLVPRATTHAASIDPVQKCITTIPVKSLVDVTAALDNPLPYLQGSQYVLCFALQADVSLHLKKPLVIAGKDKPLQVIGLVLHPPKESMTPTPIPFVSISGANVTLQDVH